jgi:hypothetical protein
MEVALFVTWGAIECAELTANPADVGVVEDSPYDVGDDIWVTPLLAAEICQRSEFERIVVIEEEEGFLGVDALVCIDLLGDRVDRNSFEKCHLLYSTPWVSEKFESWF